MQGQDIHSHTRVLSLIQDHVPNPQQLGGGPSIPPYRLHHHGHRRRRLGLLQHVLHQQLIKHPPTRRGHNSPKQIRRQDRSRLKPRIGFLSIKILKGKVIIRPQPKQPIRIHKATHRRVPPLLQARNIPRHERRIHQLIHRAGSEGRVLLHPYLRREHHPFRAGEGKHT